MNLHDKIMGVIPDDIANGGEEFYDGFAEASRKSASIAKEASALMEDMAQELAYYTDDVKTAAVWKRYKAWKESAK